MSETMSIDNTSQIKGKAGRRVRHLGYGTLIARRFFRQKSAVAGVVLFVLLLLFALLCLVLGTVAGLSSTRAAAGPPGT